MEAVLQSGLRCVEMGHEVEVLTVDAPAVPFLADYPLPVHALGPPRGGYRYTAKLVPWLRAHAADYSAVVVNGLWQFHGFGAWLALRRSAVPYFVFPHGMLDPWFKHTYPLKHIKKCLYWRCAEQRLLRDARAVLFTCEEERRLARLSFQPYRARERVVAFGTCAPPRDSGVLRERFFRLHPALRDKRTLLFLGRIHEKKGCDLLVQAFARVAALDPDLRLLMAGPDATRWTDELQRQAQALGVADRICWPGMLQGEAKWGAFYASEVFVLPSHQENFGIAVAEALGCGLPVVISDKVNIWREIETDGAGIVAPDTVAGTEAGLRKWLALDDDARDAMRRRARRSFERRFHIDAMAADLIEVVTCHG